MQIVLFKTVSPYKAERLIIKTLRIMKVTTFLLFAASLQISAKGIAQKVTLSLKNVPVQVVFKEVSRQTGMSIVYNENLFKEFSPVTINVKNAPVEQVLEKCLKGQPVSYSVENNTIAIKAKSNVTSVYQSGNNFSPPPPLPIDVHGKVVNENDQPLEGITITVKGTKHATSTDAKGFFTLKNVDEDATLVFTGVNIVSYEEKVNKRNDLNVISLRRRVIAAEEIVVTVNTGYQERKKANIVGSISIATAKDIENIGITTFEKGLAGKIPGVYIRSVTGRPGETGQIIIRGINTLTGAAEPLYVLDGMPLQTGEVSGGVNGLITNGIGNIPPENIETITILKDATAASIYGSRAANGVIVITTKTGKAGSDYVNYSGKFGITMRPENKFNFMNSEQKIRFEQGLIDDFHPPYETGGRVVQLQNLVSYGALSQASADSQVALLKQTNTNWINHLYRRAFSQSHNIILSGGNTKTTYYTSLNYQNSQGSLIENRYQTAGMTMKLARFITDKLLVKVNLYTTFKKNQEGGGLQGGIDPFKYAVFANPYERPYNDDGSYAIDRTYRSIPYTVGSSSALYYTDFNMIREMRENKLTNLYSNIRGQFSLEYNFLKYFKYTGNVVASYTSVHDKDEAYSGTYRSWAQNWLNSTSTGGLGVLPQHNRGFLQESTGRTFDYTIRNTFEFNKTFAGKHFTQAFFANEFGASTNDQFRHFNPIYLQQYAIAGYPTLDLVPDNRYTFMNLARFGSTKTAEDRSVSFIGSLAYVYDNRYVFNGNVRYDGVDILGSDNQFSPLWSAGVKWNAHNESFIKKHEFINRLVLSAGYGYRGSINRSVLPFPSYFIGTGVYGGVPLATSFNYGNPVIRWEKKKETNLGLELSLFKGRFNTELRYFDENVIDLLDNTVTAPSTGRTSATINSGSLTNKGYEVTARVEVIKNKDWLWEVGGNVTQVKNNLYSVYLKDVPVNSVASTYNIQGYPVNGWFGYKYSHVDPQTGSMMVFAQKRSTKLVGGEVKTSYSDELVNLSTITISDLTTNYSTYYLGHRDPEIYGGFNSRVVYKSFELGAYFVMAAGNQILSFRDRREGPSPNTGDIGVSRTNRLVENLNRWRQAGDITNIPLYRYNTSNYTFYMISTDVEDGSYLKCTEASLSWRASGGLLKKTGMKTLKATLVASNVFSWSKYSGTDPETQTPFGYPNTRNFALTLNVGF